MHKLFPLVLAALGASSAAATPVDLSMVSANAIDGELPFAIFTRGAWRAAAGAEYVKLHLYFDEAFPVSRVEVTSCNEPFATDTSMFTNFDEEVGGMTLAGTAASYAYTSPRQVRSLTFNFGQRRGVCIAGVKVLDLKGAPYQVRVPRVIKGAMRASSTTKPEGSYHVLNMFDSRFEYAWASDKATAGVVLDATLDEAQSFDSLRVWNGYQRSDVHCWSNSRLKKLKLEGDDGYAAQVELRDAMGSQTVTLPVPFRGKRLKMTVVDAYPGKKYKDLVISELRFGGGGSWFMLDPLGQIQATVRQNRDAFAKAKLGDVLDRGLAGQSSQRQDSSSGEWTIRLRSDGSFFLEGQTSEESDERMEVKQQQFFGLGNYEIKGVTADSLRMRIFGFLQVYEDSMSLEMDCNGCGRDCNVSAGPGESKQKIFEETLVLQGSGGQYELLNKSQKHINFKLLLARLEADQAGK